MDEGTTYFCFDPMCGGAWEIDGTGYPLEDLTEARVEQAIAEGADEIRVGRPGDLILARILGHQVPQVNMVSR